MADKYGVHPLAQSVHHDRSDEESATPQFNELRRKKKIKCFAYIAAGVVFQIIIIGVLGLTVLKIKTPSVKLSSVTVHNLSNGTSASSALGFTLMAQVAIKNTNFGHYKFDSSTANVSYGGVTVAETVIPKGRVKARSTRRVNVTMEVTSDRLSGIPSLTTDINSGTLTLSSQVKLSGKVQLMKIMKKRKTREMNCTMTINLTSQEVQNLSCD